MKNPIIYSRHLIAIHDSPRREPVKLHVSRERSFCAVWLESPGVPNEILFTHSSPSICLNYGVPLALACSEVKVPVDFNVLMNETMAKVWAMAGGRKYVISYAPAGLTMPHVPKFLRSRVNLPRAMKHKSIWTETIAEANIFTGTETDSPEMVGRKIIAELERDEQKDACVSTKPRRTPPNL